MIQDRIAIDIALLLPAAVNERVESANAVLFSRSPEGFRFDNTHLPHITLVQLFVRRANVPALIERIDPILRGMQPLALRIAGVGSSTSAAHFAIEPTPKLQKLHGALLDAVKPFEEAIGDAAAFYSGGGPSPERAREGDVAWVSNFRSQSSYDRFSPHITLGIGPPPEFHEPFEFTAKRVAVCHLGRFCTCRMVLREWALRARP